MILSTFAGITCQLLLEYVSGHQFLLKVDKDSWGKRTAGRDQSGQ